MLIVLLAALITIALTLKTETITKLLTIAICITLIAFIASTTFIFAAICWFCLLVLGGTLVLIRNHH